MQECLPDLSAEQCCAKLADFCPDQSAVESGQRCVTITQGELPPSFLGVRSCPEGKRWVSLHLSIRGFGDWEKWVQAPPFCLGTATSHWDLAQVINPLFVLLVPREKDTKPTPLKTSEFFRRSYQCLCTPKPFVINKPLYPLAAMHFVPQHAISQTWDNPGPDHCLPCEPRQFVRLICLKTCTCQQEPFYFIYVDTKISHIDFCVAVISCKLSKQWRVDTWNNVCPLRLAPINGVGKFWMRLRGWSLNSMSCQNKTDGPELTFLPLYLNGLISRFLSFGSHLSVLALNGTP